MKNLFGKISTWFTGLSPFVRNIIILAMIILLFAIVVLIIQALEKAKKEKQLNQAFDDDIKTLTQSGQVPSYPETTYKNLADRIEGASEGFVFGLGTDEEAMISVFTELKNELDVVKLEKAFGARIPPDCVAFCDARPLGDYLAYELGEDVAKVNKVLSNNGINMRF